MRWLSPLFYAVIPKTVRYVTGCNISRENLIALGASADCWALTMKKFKWIARSIRGQVMFKSTSNIFFIPGLEII
jgi:hypothetical protein